MLPMGSFKWVLTVITGIQILKLWNLVIMEDVITFSFSHN